MSEAASSAPTGPEFAIQRIYVKDLSFEAPNSPEIFRTEWKPVVDFDLNTNSVKLTENEDVHEVTLSITSTVKVKEKVAFIVELKLAGIFTLKSFTKEQLGHMLGSFCPNILFPYSREIISDVVNRGTFPPFYLAPVNFDALYQQFLEKQKKEKEGSSGSETKH